MSGEMIAIIAVGVAIAGLNHHYFGSLEKRLDRMAKRLDGMAAEMAALRDGLTREIRSLAERVAKLEA